MTDDNYNLVPPHRICGKELSVISENDVINVTTTSRNFQDLLFTHSDEVNL